jgi:hypothetical protein
MTKQNFENRGYRFEETTDNWELVIGTLNNLLKLRSYFNNINYDFFLMERKNLKYSESDDDVIIIKGII